MRKLTMTLAAATLLCSVMAVAANAQTQLQGAAGLHAQIQNATPIEKTACRGYGPHCPPGFTWTCGYGRCWCRPCR